MKPIALTMGEPAGIGPDIILQLAAQKPALFSEEKIIIVGNGAVLASRAEMLGIPFHQNTFSILEVPLSQPVIPGQLNQANASFVIDMLTLATESTMQKKFSSIVTAPIHKGVLNDAGFSFAGHTDFFAKYTGCKTVMMLMTPSLKVALLTDHIPLRAVPDAVTEKNLSDCLDIILHDFQQRLHITNPKILICGLNPHAGESGYLGTEEQAVIIPVIKKYCDQGYRIIGPMGADVAFTDHYRNQADVVLALYHDQGLPIIKYSGFHEAINVTLGLPFIRTSVDHGTALDIAGTGRADASSLHHALLFAEKISHEHTHAA